MKIAFIVSELHYLKLVGGGGGGGGGVNTTEHIDVLCSVNPKNDLSNFVFHFTRKEKILFICW